MAIIKVPDIMLYKNNEWLSLKGQSIYANSKWNEMGVGSGVYNAGDWYVFGQEWLLTYSQATGGTIKVVDYSDTSIEYPTGSKIVDGKRLELRVTEPSSAYTIDRYDMSNVIGPAYPINPKYFNMNSNITITPYFYPSYSNQAYGEQRINIDFTVSNPISSELTGEFQFKTQNELGEWTTKVRAELPEFSGTTAIQAQTTPSQAYREVPFILTCRFYATNSPRPLQIIFDYRVGTYRTTGQFQIFELLDGFIAYAFNSSGYIHLPVQRGVTPTLHVDIRPQ